RTASQLRIFTDNPNWGRRGVLSSMKRRNFLHTMVALPAAVSSLRAGTSTDSVGVSGRARTRILPRGLAAGSTIGIVCPASAATAGDVKDFIDLCTLWGIRVKFGRNISRRNGYLSAPDVDRAAEFMDFIEDPGIDAVVCARGGYGVMRILPMLDFVAIRQSGKIIMGFSDITALLIAIQQLTGMVTFHGPVASSTFDPFTVQSLKSVVDASDAKPLVFRDTRLTTLRPGIAQGRLTGGNLSMIVSTLGTKYEIDTTDAILFLEEVNEEPFRVDRMLTQLWLAGKLQSCRGIALGNFRDCEAKGTSITGPSFTLDQVFEQRIASIGVPAIYGLPVGHVKSKLTMPLGVKAELDATNKQLRLLEPAVVLPS
ncbi:MAG: LD-carboxypeptidase, partial [Candidatus Kapabacteria bacterium]|nr:LD-carboxypeptidase [Candidatus Kapabacteria bacterium]